MEINEMYKILNQKANVKFENKTPTVIIERLDKIYKQAQAKSNTEAYIMLKRWILCVEWLQKQNVDERKVKQHYSNDKIRDVKTLLKNVSKSIQIEFEAKNKLSSIADNSNIVNTISQINNVDDISLQLPETPSDEPQPKERHEITCKELFELLSLGKNNEKRVLIIDTRKAKDYLELRIAFHENLINIPADKLEPKILPILKNLLSFEDKKIIGQYSKNCVDTIVLIESNSTFGNMRINSTINLKDCLDKWDIFKKDKKLVVLKGGFEEWMETYPTMITNHSIKESTIKNDMSIDILDYTSCHNSYLPSDENFASSPILCTAHPPGVKIKSLSPSNLQITKKSSASTSTLNNVNSRQLTNLMNNFYYTSENIANDRQLLLNNNIKEAMVVLEKLPMKSFTKLPARPPVDRSKKPNLEKKSGPSTLSLHDRLELDVWSREQLDTLLKTEQERVKFYHKTETESFKKPQLYPDLSALKSEFNKSTLRSVKQDLNQDKENIQELRKRVEQTKIEQKIKIEPSLPQSMDIDDEEIYTMPLKSESLTMNSGLKRSISSPNLMQQGELKRVPDFSRSLKPNRGYDNTSYSRPMSGISLKNREQRMEPVYASSGLHPGITGLKNLGNSCYMNSIIQCLSNTVYLAQYFISNLYINDLNKNTDKGVTGYVAEEVAQVIKALWRGQYKSISPRDLKVVVGQYKLQFESYDQQDSHEFLMFLLDWMHNDLKQKSKVSYDRPLTTAEKEWEKSMDGQSSIISKLFFGQLRSTIECLCCGKNSTTYETFNSLTMSLPVSSRCTLDDCVIKFVSGQNVSGWKCPSCKVPREGVKKFDIAKLPHIIVIHLNRFGDTGGWLEKKNTAVEFPLSNFNLRTYLAQDNDSLNNSQIFNYNLYAMSNHYGTMDGGHYTAYCKSNTQNKWYKYDDHTVTEVHQSQVKSQSNSAYLLFYTSVSAEPYLNS